MKYQNASLAVAGMALMILAGTSLAAENSMAKSKDTVWPAEAIAWKDGPAKGTHVAALWGDMNKGGSYGVLIKFDAGVMHPLHWHTRSLKIIVVQGTFLHQPEGGAQTKLGPGSYVLQAGGGKHVSGCAEGSECQFAMISDGKFDMKMAEGTPAPK